MSPVSQVLDQPDLSASTVGLKAPVAEAQRIHSLDVLRGFALLGILLLNIIEFGLIEASYSNPAVDLADGSALDVGVWATVELFAEGAMRCVFSMLFGAGVVLFATGARAKSGWLHYKRTFWLAMIGLFDVFVLLWIGDILVTYALAGAILYWFRNLRVRWLLAIAASLLVVISSFYGVVRLGLGTLQGAAVEVAEAADPDRVAAGTREMAAQWQDFAGDFSPSAEEQAKEIAARSGNYASAFKANAANVPGMLGFVMPVFLIWDALLMMIIGMALFKMGVLHGHRSDAFYKKLMLFGFSIGLAVNGFEVWNGLRTDFDIFSVFAQMQPTYHFGRLGMGLGYIGLVVLFAKSSGFVRLRSGLASVGRMALTNYLMHSLFALLIFSGAGLGLVGVLSRAQLYPIVIAIWIVQLFFSEWWLLRFQFGPVEWVWRMLTYGKRPAFRRSAG